MTQEQKDLLLKDLCARLPYNVKVNCNDKVYNFNGIQYFNICTLTDDNENNAFTTAGIKYIKPYLFPLSSMTDEQWMDTPYANLNKYTFDSFKCGCSTLAFETYEVNLSYVVEFINWCYKNHFDIYGLIPMGLANDATGLNIY